MRDRRQGFSSFAPLTETASEAVVVAEVIYRAATDGSQVGFRRAVAKGQRDTDADSIGRVFLLQ